MLSILCVTQAEPFSYSFLGLMQEMALSLKAELCLVADGDQAAGTLFEIGLPVARVVHSSGYIESVLDDALETCHGEYVLRLDDDESCSWPMYDWLREGCYRAHDHWQFPRAHLWGDEVTFINHPQLWPDHQTRLSVKAKSGGRTQVHAGSPFGPGMLAPVVLTHHKFLVKTAQQRGAVAARYDRVHRGFGTGNMLVFNLPEVAIKGMDLQPLPQAYEFAFAQGVA